MFSSIASRAVPAACFGVVLAVASAATAQTAPPPSTPKRDPLDAGAVVPPVQHRSAVASYRGHAEQPVVSWRDANDTVTGIGGWRTYAREARQPDAPVAAPAASSSAPTKPAAVGQPGHAGHAGSVKP